jgi:hypothetical protein
MCPLFKGFHYQIAENTENTDKYGKLDKSNEVHKAQICRNKYLKISIQSLGKQDEGGSSLLAKCVLRMNKLERITSLQVQIDTKGDETQYGSSHKEYKRSFFEKGKKRRGGAEILARDMNCKRNDEKYADESGQSGKISQKKSQQVLFLIQRVEKRSTQKQKETFGIDGVKKE